MMTLTFLAVLAILLPSLSGCAMAPDVSQPGSGRLAHQVVFFLHDWSPEGTADRMVKFYVEEVPKVPGVDVVFVGKPRPSERDVVDDSYTLSTTTIFASSEAETVWQTHPIHLQFIAEFEQFFERVIVYDTQE